MFIKGYVLDASTSAPLIGATILVMMNGQPTGEGTTTDENGFYQLNVANPQSDIKAQYIGYISQTTSAGNEDFYLQTYTNQLPGVTITAPKPTNNMDLSTPGPTWAEMKPLLIGVAVIFVVGYAIASKTNK